MNKSSPHFRSSALAVILSFALAACAPSEPPRIVESPAIVAVPAAAPTLEPKVVAVGEDEPAEERSDAFRDPRDGQAYRLVVIGDRVWFAENLRYAVPGSWCYEDRESACSRFGRLYQWEPAMNACPRGWRLPSEEEWQAVEDAYPGPLEPLLEGGASHFEILLGGERRTDGRFQDMGTNFYFWTSTTLEDRARLRWNLSDSGLQIATDVKTEAYSVRCVREQ